MLPIDVQNRHGKSNEAATNDTENTPEVSAAKRYDFIACEKKMLLIYYFLEADSELYRLSLSFVGRSGGNIITEIPRKTHFNKKREKINLRETCQAIRDHLSLLAMMNSD